MLGNILGAVAGSLVSAKMSQKSADKQMRFQAGMSGTAYQRAMADMRKAGLNPILAGKLGPASTPSGAMANIPDFGQTFNTAYSNQTQRMQTEANIGKIDAEVEKIAAETGLTKGQTELLKDTAYLYKTQAEKAIADANLSSAQATGKGLQNVLDEMFVRVMDDHEFVYTAHKLDMGPGQLVDLLKTIIGKKLPNINVMKQGK
jgi:hypothetical protein